MQNVNSGLKLATFAGGCFWCMVSPFEDMQGVLEVKTGYTGGKTENPTYREVCSGSTGHYEAIQIVYDPSKVSYRQLLDIFWQQIDPTDPGGQFQDRGQQYHTVIFYHDDEQKLLAEESKAGLENSGKFDKPVATRIIKASQFFTAEEYHQDYYKKNPQHYKSYKTASGREDFVKKMWSEGARSCPLASKGSIYARPDKDELKKQLTPMQYKVTQENGTEPPFQNEYFNNKKEGIYVDIVNGEPLFSSNDKFDSGCGWPSFTKPLSDSEIIEKEDRSLSMVRTEVRSKTADSHLGHVFNDGPKQEGGLRYCINSSALRFIPVDDLEKEGYGEYLKLFR